ncbi:flap endonuclease 1-B-like isoform X1 [Lolium rigidum]|uniref:flap endonuclease 1-B-like isoform X1 n=1 Tax=Lolium rigidum TaxID=89674 RepID=UPI001F5D6378|nr:flap endonuclease 1-B-like isoform X1 [Lolium rigidum]
MGIKGLTKLLAEHAPRAATLRRVEDYRGRVIAIDASLSIYQFLVVVGRKGTEVLTNEAGEVTRQEKSNFKILSAHQNSRLIGHEPMMFISSFELSSLNRSHLQGMLNRTVRLLEAGIKPVFVFDGEPPDLKKKELAKRSLKRDDASKDLHSAIEVGDEDSIEKLSKRTVKMTKKHNDDCKRLLGLMGVPVVEAPGEAEAQCASLCENHKAYAVASEDMDSLTFGARRFLRHVTDLSFKKSPVTEFEMSKVLEELGLTMDQFIDLCILSGCDYCENIKGIGGQRALKLIREYGCIEEVVPNLNKRYIVPEDWPYQEVRTLFKKPNVTTEIPDFQWTSADKEGLVNFLALENSFSSDRVEKAVEKIKASRDRYSPGRVKLLTPVADLQGSTTEKESKCVIGASGHGLKSRSALQVCRSSSSDFRYGSSSSKPLVLGRQSGFRAMPHAFSFI